MGAVSVFLGPLIAMLYLNKGWHAVAFGIANLCAFLIIVVLLHFDFINMDVALLIWAVMTIIAVVGFVHCLILSRRFDVDKDLAWYAKWPAIIGFYAVPFLIILLFRVFIYQPLQIPSDSMAPTLTRGDYSIAEKFAYGFRAPAFFSHYESCSYQRHPLRGDVILFKNRKDAGRLYVKRVIGLPGETIEIISNRVFVDGVLLTSEIDGLMVATDAEFPADHIQFREYTAEGVSYNVFNSSFSVPSPDTVTYIVPYGHYFVLGDNRPHSADSRFHDQMGFVPEQDIVGRVRYIFWDGDAQKFIIRQTSEATQTKN